MVQRKRLIYRPSSTPHLGRITTTDYAADTVIWPRLAKILPTHADLKIEINIDSGLADVVTQRFDLGVRNGDQVAKDMVAVRIAPDRRMVIVGSPTYLASRPRPKKPADLLQHNFVGLRFASGGLYAWELKRGKQEVQVRPDSQVVINVSYQY